MPLPRRREPLSILLVVGCVLAIVGCGSSSPPEKRAAVAQGLRFASCMRSHGVPHFPDPSSSGSFGGSGINPASPAFNAAQSACEHLLAGGSRSGQPSTAVRAQLLAFSKCMRAHDVSGFPDPTTTRPFRVSSLVDAGGLYLGIPISIEANSPAFKRAVKACHAPPGF